MKYIKTYEESTELIIKYPNLNKFDISNEPQEGDYVFIHKLYFLDNKPKLGKIVKKSNQKWYSIDLEDGTNYKNNIKYIRKATPEEKNKYKLLLQTNKYNL